MLITVKNINQIKKGVIAQIIAKAKKDNIDYTIVVIK